MSNPRLISLTGYWMRFIIHPQPTVIFCLAPRYTIISLLLCRIVSIWEPLAPPLFVNISFFAIFFCTSVVFLRHGGYRPTLLRSLLLSNFLPQEISLFLSSKTRGYSLLILLAWLHSSSPAFNPTSLISGCTLIILSLCTIKPYWKDSANLFAGFLHPKIGNASRTASYFL